MYKSTLILTLSLVTWITWANMSETSKSMTETNLPGPITPTGQILPDRPQGLQGTVLLLSGNQMPAPQPDPTRSPPQPIQTNVWIFSGKISGSGSPRWPIAKASQHPQLVGWTSSDVTGRFAVGLPPGEYTVMAEYDADLYLNSFLGDGSYTSVQVTANQMFEVELINTENAAF